MPSTLVTSTAVPWSRVQVSWITFGEKITFPKVLFVWTLFDIVFVRNTEIGKKQQFWAGPPVNRLVPKIIIKWEIKPNIVQNSR